MNKITLKVPYGIKYISEWKEYSMPKGHCIVDKGVTGCGYTEMCLMNSLNVILCSPRRLLLENKAEQHVQDSNILYLENDMSDSSDLTEVKKYYEKMRQHILDCSFKGLPVKFMITYDSAYHLINFLKETNQLQYFHVVADEFQSIFLDSYFKPNTENSFVESLQSCPNVIYLSATPMLEKYLVQLDEFKDLDYYSIDWSGSGYVEIVRIQRKRTNSLGTEADKVIKSYLSGDYPITIDDNNNVVQSKEAVFYFNSVSEIVRLIKRNKLTSDQCNIICSSTNKKKDNNNARKIKKLGPGFKIGKIPTRGEKNKMFTFCTSTSYIGADFYSTNASTYIFADPNLRCLALDISLDLPQIVGRQRDRNNPFKNNVIIFYKTLRSENLEDRKQFDEIQKERRLKTDALLSIYYTETNDLKRRALMDGLVAQAVYDNYVNNFVSISKNTGLPVYNKLIDIANERAWEVSQKDYQDTISVTKALQELEHTEVVLHLDKDDKVMNEFLDDFYSTGVFTKKLKLFCDFMENNKDNLYLMKVLSFKVPDPRFKNYYNFFGLAGCRARRYREDLLRPELLDILKGDELSSVITSSFKPGDKLGNKQIKEKLRVIYSNLKFSKNPKATDLEQWFDTRPGKVYSSEENRWVHGLELLAYKK